MEPVGGVGVIQLTSAHQSKRLRRRVMKGVVRVAPVLSLAVLLLTTFSLPAQTAFQKEISTMKRTAAVFDRCSSMIETAVIADDMVSALSTTAEELQAVFPEMTSVSKSHPDWGNSPPAEVAPTMKLFDRSVNRLFDEALPKATAFVNGHPHNQSLQQAFSKVNAILYSQ